jgi:hypothetical protein
MAWCEFVDRKVRMDTTFPVNFEIHLYMTRTGTWRARIEGLPGAPHAVVTPSLGTGYGSPSEASHAAGLLIQHVRDGVATVKNGVFVVNW